MKRRVTISPPLGEALVQAVDDALFESRAARREKEFAPEKARRLPFYEEMHDRRIAWPHRQA